MALGSVHGLDAAALGGSIFEIVALAGMLVLVLMLVALGGVAYKSLTGDGIRWPDEDETVDEEDEVSRGDSDDDWKYY